MVLVPRPALIALLLDALEDDVIVGADGLRSAVRQAYFPGRSCPRDAGFTAWREVTETDTSEHGEIWGRGLLFGVTAMAPGCTNWYAAVAGHAHRLDPAHAMSPTLGQGAC